MERKDLVKCFFCSGSILINGDSPLVKCPRCGESMAVAAFESEPDRLEKEQQKTAEAEAALDAALKQKEAAEQRLFRAIAQMEDISLSQEDQKKSLEMLLSEQKISKNEVRALRQLLDSVYGKQDAFTEYLSAVLQGQETADEKLKSLQEVSEKLLQSQDDVIGLIEYLKTDKRESNRLINQMFAWVNNADQETTRRLKGLQTSSGILQGNLQCIDQKIDTLNSNIKSLSNKIDQFESRWEQSQLKKISHLYHQAESKQKSRDFEKAEEYYRDVISNGGEDPEVYWRLILCHYSVEYQTDNDGLYLPTILYPSLDDPRELPDWMDLLENCRNSPELLEHYEKLLAPIEQIIRLYSEFRQTVHPEVFICVKQKENDHWTVDSDTGSELYDLIRRKNLSVFNSRRSTIPAGMKFEPYIIAALLSAKLMIVVGTSADHMEARWVKNEWTRFQWLQEKEIKQTGKTDRRLVCYLKGMSPKHIPKELHPDIQAIEENATSSGTLDRLLNETFALSETKHDLPQEDDTEVIYSQMEIWLAFGDYTIVEQRCKTLINEKRFINESRLHLYALCANYKVSDFEQLAELKISLGKEAHFRLAQKKAVDRADQELIKELLRINADANQPSNPPQHPPAGSPPAAHPEKTVSNELPQNKTPEQPQDRPLQKPESDKVRQLKKKAENGDAISQFYLARCYETGDGTEQNYPEAFRWYQIAAAAGNAAAQCNLGCCYHKGWGVARDDTKAVLWYQKSADQGDDCGQNNLGVMYENGTGVPKDYQKAAEWYRKSADQNYVSAQYNLGRFFENGLGVEQNYSIAAQWYRKAADQGHEKAGTCLLNLEQKIGEQKRKKASEPPVIQSLEINSADGRLDHYLESNHLSKTWIRDLNWPDSLVFINGFITRISVRIDYEQALGDSKEEIFWQILTEDGKPFTAQIRESRAIQPGSVKRSLCWWQYAKAEDWPEGVYSVVATVNGSAPFIQHFRVVSLSELMCSNGTQNRKQQPVKKDTKPNGTYSNPKTGYEKEFVADTGAARKWTVPSQTDKEQKAQPGPIFRNLHVFEADDSYTGVYLSNLFIQRSVLQLGVQFGIDHVEQPEYATIKWKVVRQDGFVLVPETTSRITLKKGDRWIRHTRKLDNNSNFIAGTYHVTAACNDTELTTSFSVVDPKAPKWQLEKGCVKSVNLLVKNAGSEYAGIALSLSRNKAKQLGVRVNFKTPSTGSEMLISWFIEREDGKHLFARINSVTKVPKGVSSVDHIILPSESRSLLSGIQNGTYKLRVFINSERPMINSFVVKE